MSDAICDLIQDSKNISLEFYNSRTPQNWLDCITKSSIAFHCSESPYDSYYYFLLMSLAEACPVICSDFSAVSDLPDSIVNKVSPGCAEQRGLAEILESYLEGSEEFYLRTLNGLAYIEENCSASAALEELRSLAKGRVLPRAGDSFSKINLISELEISQEVVRSL